MKSRILAVVVALHLVLLDAVAKELAAGYLKGSAAVSVLPNLFDLAYVENRGCAWGMFQGQVWPLALFGLLALGLLIWKRERIFFSGLKPSTVGYRLARVAEPLLLAGIVGNVIDRLVRGYVIDFLDFHWYGSHFPCFNLADTFICCAVGLLLLVSLRSVPREES